jgi:putative membrane protein
MIRKMMFAGAAALLFASAAHAQPVNGGHSDATMDFVKKAAQSDAFEREEGRLAERRAHDPMVRKFAAEMVSAHTMTTKGLKMAIRRAHMAPPPPPALTGDQMHMIADLQGAHGGAFDKMYIDQQVQAHQDALGLMQGYAQTGAPGPLRDAAAKTAPLVQHHLDMAKGLQAHTG